MIQDKRNFAQRYSFTRVLTESLTKVNVKYTIDKIIVYSSYSFTEINNTIMYYTIIL